MGSVSAAHPDHPLLLAGVAFLLAGLAFKLGAVPFQAWVPDVYQGAPTAVSAYLAVASKSAGFIVLYNLVSGPLAGMSDFLMPALSVVAALTILMGNLGALTQRNVKRLMGLSGVAHAGYLLVGIVAAMHPEVPEHRVFWAIAFYLLTYLLASYGVFGVMSLVPSDDDSDQPLSGYSSLAQKQPFLAFVLATSLGSLAGIPPLAGFIGKLLLFVVIFQAGLHGLFGVMLIGVVISIYYYFAWIRQAIFPPLQAFDEVEEQRRAKLSAIVISFPVTLVLMLVVIAIIGLGIYQGSIGENF
ncbi:MAG: hypothetical protein CMI31_03920 [Opitutae bacterium]|nr:hypothetical protein [Opitutae bacterium]